MASLKISKKIKKGFRRGVSSVVKAIFPARCLGCGSLFQAKAASGGMSYENSEELHGNCVNGFERETAPFLCSACRDGFIPIQSPICCRCGMMFESRTGDDHLCGVCIEKPPVFAKARSLGIYDESLMSLIHAFKYAGKIQLAGPLGGLLLDTFLFHWQKCDIDLIVPIPLHPKRLRERGFNQALMLVRNWSDMIQKADGEDWPVQISPDVVSRTKWTRPQTGLNKKDRRKNIKNAFHVKDMGAVTDKRILLVDDVYTTGATLHECSRVLKRAGAKKIDVLTVARA